MYRKKKAGIIVIVLLLMITIILIGGIYIRKNYTVKDVTVEGNHYYTAEEIKEMVLTGPLQNNTIYLSLKYRNREEKNIPFIDILDVEVLSKDSVKITVFEKILTGYVRYLDTYIYIDKDGCVVESSSEKIPGIPQILGLKFDKIVLGEQLPVEDKKVFYDILDVTRILDKYEIVADRIFFANNKEVTAYIGNIKVLLGNDSKNLENKIMILRGLLAELVGKSGTLQMQTYDENNKKYTFKQE